MKRKSFMKKLTSLVLCSLMIVGNGVVFGAPAIPASDPSVAPDSDWNLVKVIDFERDAGFTLGQTANGSTVSFIKENADTPTGWYNDNTGSIGTANTVSISGFPTLNQDAVSVKFKFWASDDWGDGSINGECVRLTMGPAGIMFNNKKTATNPGAFIISANTNGWGSKPFKDADGNNITYKNGWNDIEIRLFKATSGADQNYTSAEYYFNGVQGTVADVANGLNVPVGTMADTSNYPLSVSCGGNVASAYRFDEIYIYDKNTSALETLDAPTNVSVTEGGVVSFEGVDNAASYDVKLYKDDTLVGKRVVLNTEPTKLNLVDDILRLGEGNYCVSVQAKGDYTTYTNSAVVTSDVVHSEASFRTIKLIDFERDSGFELGDTVTIIEGGTWSWVEENIDTVTGQYFANGGSATSAFTYPTCFPMINQDSVSVKFKFWASDNWENADGVYIGVGPAGISVTPKIATSNSGVFCGSTDEKGWGGTPFKNSSGENITYKNGWNDIEIRLFKAIPGADQNYTSAEYYFNGVQGTSSGQTNGLNPGRAAMADTSVYPFGVRCGGSGTKPYRIDEIYISDLSADTTTKLSTPANVSIGGGATVSFEKTENTNYAVKLYDSEGVLKATKTVLAADDTFSGFGTEIYNLGIGEYTFKVNAKGDYSTTRNSDEVSVSSSDFIKYGPYLVSGFASSVNVENSNLTFNAGANVLRGISEGNAPYTFIVALYDGGDLADVSLCVLDETAIQTVGASQNLSGAVTDKATGYDGTIDSLPDFTAKIFSWNDFNTLQPIGDIDLKNVTKQDIFNMLSQN